jgi:hypothetical protein
MALIMTTDRACILDHSKAIEAAYRSCITSATDLSDTSSLQSASSCGHECNDSGNSTSQEDTVLNNSDANIGVERLATNETAKSCVTNATVKSYETNVKAAQDTPCSQHEVEEKSLLSSSSRIHCQERQDQLSHASRDTCHHVSAATDSVTESQGQSPITNSYRLKDGFFCVKFPYMMDTQFESVKKHLQTLEKHEHLNVQDIRTILVNKVHFCTIYTIQHAVTICVVCTNAVQVFHTSLMPAISALCI